jgi:hypothetical protein
MENLTFFFLSGFSEALFAAPALPCAPSAGIVGSEKNIFEWALGASVRAMVLSLYFLASMWALNHRGNNRQLFTYVKLTEQQL